MYKSYVESGDLEQGPQNHGWWAALGRGNSDCLPDFMSVAVHFTQPALQSGQELTSRDGERFQEEAEMEAGDLPMSRSKTQPAIS